MSNLPSHIFRLVLKLVFGLSAAVLAVGVLLVALTILVLSVLKALITGRKPAPAMAFARFQQFSQQGMRPASHAPRTSPKAASDQVVDVEVREISAHRQHS